MDCACHVTMKLSGLSVPDCNMDCVCHVTMKLSGLSIPDCNMDCVCHAATDVSGLSILNVHMESDHGYHVNKIEFCSHGELKSVPTCQEPCCKRDIQLAYMSSIIYSYSLISSDYKNQTGYTEGIAYTMCSPKLTSNSS